MRNPDWNGNPPKNDKLAKERIINAAVSVAERDGITKTNIKKVAEELNITRQTVYRLFPSTDDLLTEVSVAAGGKILHKLLKNAERFDSFEDRVIDSMIFLARNIPKDDFLKQYFLSSENENASIKDAFIQESLNYAFQILKAIHPEKQDDLDEVWLMELAEHMQRILLSLVIAPSERTKTAKGIKGYLNNWLKPLLSQHRQPFSKA